MKVNKTSPDFVVESQNWLKEKFPSCFIEGKLDFEKFKELFSEVIDISDEKYSFSWAGRSESLKSIRIPTIGTLNPDKEKSIDFDDTENIFVQGENLEVLKLFEKSYSNKIKMIYIDPPYNTGNDFIYKDDFKNNVSNYLAQTGQTKFGILQTTNKQTSGRFHSDWMSFIYPRLFIARTLLKDDGLIFISIDNGEIHNLRILMNEIFGEENFISDIVWQKKFSRQSDAKFFSDNHEYLLCYAKNKHKTKINLLPRSEKQNQRYKNSDDDPRGPWAADNLIAKTYSKKYDYEIITPSGRKVTPPHGYCWMVSEEKLGQLIKENKIWFGLDGKNVPRIKRFLNEVQSGIVPTTLWFRDETGDTQEAVREFKDLLPDAKFDNPKPTKLLKLIINLTTLPDQNDLILDFFAGSSTMAQSVLEQNFKDNGNRRFLLVQIPEKIKSESSSFNQKYNTIADIGTDRIYHVIKKLHEENKQQKLDDKSNQDLGFKVFKLSKSNYKIWEDVKDEAKLKEQLTLFEDPLVENYKDIDVIYEIILKEGYSLNSKIEEHSQKPNKIYKVIDDEFFFYVTLDKKLNEKTISELKLDKNVMFVCLDSALDDSQKTNLDKLCKLKII